MLLNKKIIVTGGAGFLGSNLVEGLINKGVSPDCIFVPRKKDYDLRNLNDIEKMFIDFPADIVIHLAANTGGIEYYKKYPATLFYDNLVMGLQLMEVARQHNVEKMVIAGTGLSYPKNAPVPIKEEFIWDGYPEEIAAPYGLASRILLEQSRVYRKEYGFNSICLIPANIYGPKDHFGLAIAHVIPATITKISNAIKNGEQEIKMLGNKNNSREFVYVMDVVNAILLGLEKYDDSSPLNIGSGQAITIEELTKKLAKIMGYNGAIIWDASFSGGASVRCFDVSKSIQKLGAYAVTPIGEGLKRTVDWFNSIKK